SSSAAGDSIGLRFNGDSGNNYWSRYISALAGATTLGNNQSTSVPIAKIFTATTTGSRAAWITITNNSGTSKVGTVDALTGTGAAGTAGMIQFGGFEWVNVAAQITSIELRTTAGLNMGPGSGIAVFGRNY